ncbi:hypothetical protein CANARDRAFT_55114 [[Candida] arabinofermentans NRRL YB-2248]|uniref:CNH domain-containing protein n=1 Tax=[Candida] arabinofermentans NRRL YB-2248 TaxID=983967 RepID=A0A1E4T8K7_9ASCO|nr:hypothetical protein CANARDRAFT_55114 [[Candida] arabinofermentans NRRL YB-2248]
MADGSESPPIASGPTAVPTSEQVHQQSINTQAKKANKKSKKKRKTKSKGEPQAANSLNPELEAGSTTGQTNEPQAREALDGSEIESSTRENTAEPEVDEESEISPPSPDAKEVSKLNAVLEQTDKAGDDVPLNSELHAYREASQELESIQNENNLEGPTSDPIEEEQPVPGDGEQVSTLVSPNVLLPDTSESKIIEEASNDEKNIGDESPEREAKELQETDVETEVSKSHDTITPDKSRPTESIDNLKNDNSQDNKEDLHDESITSPIASNGPYSMIDLVSDIPLKNPDIPSFASATITSIETWDMNMYIGTSCGELIHMYKIDDEIGYIQVSRQRFSSSKSKPVEKILLLPELSKALVLCGSTLSAYILPELSPANIGKIRDVTDISIDYNELQLDANQHNYVTPIDHINGEVYVKVTVFTKKSVRLIRIFDEGMKLFKDVHYPLSIQGIQRSKFAAVGTKIDYDLIDLVQVQKIPLFPVSTTGKKLQDTETDNDDQLAKQKQLRPIICPVGNSEFMMACGGSSIDDPALGMVVNLNGDVSRGTIPWESYPSCLTVDFPYSIAVFHDSAIQIHSLIDQAQVQDIKFPAGWITGVKSVSHVFKMNNKELCRVLKQVPFISKSTLEESLKVVASEDEEATKFMSSSSCLVFDKAGSSIKLLVPQAKPLRLIQLYESTTRNTCNSIFDELADDLKDDNIALTHTNESDEAKDEKNFLLCILGLLGLKFYMFNHCFELWCGNVKKLDPRILLYIFGCNKEKIVGSVWQYQGLTEKVEELRKQYASADDTTAINEFLKLYLNSCISNDLVSDIDTLKSVEISLIEAYADSEDIMEILTQIKHSSDDAIEILMTKKRYYYLARYYEKLEDHHQFLYYWRGLLEGDLLDTEYDKHFKDQKKSLNYISNYLTTNCHRDVSTIWKYGEWLLANYPHYGYMLFTNKNLEKIDINDTKVLQLLDDQPDIKLDYLEYMIKKKNEKQFTGDLILALMDQLLTLTTPEVQTELLDLLKRYQELPIPRLPLTKYYGIEMNRFTQKKVLSLSDRLYHYLSLINKDTRSILNQKPIVDECFKRLHDFEEVFPMLAVMLHFKKSAFEKVVLKFTELGDFSSAESFANTLRLVDTYPPNALTPHNSSAKANKLQEIEPPLSSASSVGASSVEKQLSEKLLMLIFDVYLEMKNPLLVELFLNNYNLLRDEGINSSSATEVNITDKMDKFIELLERIPDNFPVAQIHTFLIRNLIEFQDFSNETVMTRNLNRSRCLSLSSTIKDLGMK